MAGSVFLLMVGQGEDLLKQLGLHIGDMSEVQGPVEQPTVLTRREYGPDVLSMIHGVSRLRGRLWQRDLPFENRIEVPRNETLRLSGLS
jgi:hypothetical protein